MKKVAIVIPPITDFYYTPHRGAFLGAWIVKKIIEEKGYITTLFDFPNKKSRVISLPKELYYLENNIIPDERGPIAFFSSYKRFGYSFDKCLRLIKEFSPDAVILSLFAFAYSQEFIDFSKKLRDCFKKLPFIAGGSGVTCFPEYFEKTGIFDTLLCGEIECLKDDLFKAIEGKTSGTIRTNRKTDKNNIEFKIVKTIKIKGQTHFSTILSRGCPKNCAFCSNFLIQGRNFRTVKLESVEREFKQYSTNSAVHFNFEDDNILLDKDYLIEVLKLLKKYFPNSTFSFENGIDYLFLNDSLVAKLIRHGISHFNLSIGSIKSEILKENKRPLSIEKLTEILHTIKKYGTKSIVYFISGLKNDSFENTISTLIFLKNLPCITGISPFYPVPGIKGFEDRGVFEKTSPLLTKGSSFYPWNRSLKTGEMIEAFRLARLSNLTKKKDKKQFELELLERIKKDNSLFTILKNGSLVKVKTKTNLREFFEPLKVTL